MKISKLARREAKGLFRFCLVNGVLNEQRVQQVIGRLLQSKPRGYLAIANQLHRLVKLEIQRRTARVETAVPLSQDLRGEVQNTLSRVYGPGLSISFAENPALIGGMRVHVGSDVYDGSIQARLAALEESF